MITKPDKKEITRLIEERLSRLFGESAATATPEQVYRAVASTVTDILSQKRSEYREKVDSAGGKKVYYICMEFLLGRSLRTNLHNLGLAEDYADALAELGFDLHDLYECEPDAGLGNGGLGRLAACFADSLASCNYPAYGFSICYEYGLFRQKIADGLQVELPDNWLPGGDVWLQPRPDRTFTVRMGGRVVEEWKNDRLEIRYENTQDVEAVPYDMMISGADSESVVRLRLFKARDPGAFNMGLFARGQYARAIEESSGAEIISKVLYPTDNHDEGKMLRLTQQYFLCSASVQNIIRDHMAHYRRIDNLAEKVAIHINDTHPSLVIPELMRVLVDDYRLSWERAWEITVKTVSYTNHTVMPEALEKWNEDIFRLRLPRIYMIIKEINERFCREAWDAFPGDWDRIANLSLINRGQMHMANLAVVGSHSVNGVSKLHSKILTDTVFKDYYRMTPRKFTNVTNGVAHRRWLCYSNPKLASLLDDTIGPAYRNDPERLADFAAYADDMSVLSRLRGIKHANKIDFARMNEKKTGVAIDTHSVFDVQIKRLHEYKRQLLNLLNIISLYGELLSDPNMRIYPRTYIFGAKAAPGYDLAKRIIQLTCLLSAEIESQPRIREQLRVVFLENYSVSLAEALIPASEISEQISLAGCEASGTGCMKLMMNGALTVGTLDGANVEMKDAVGADNIYIFGLGADDVANLRMAGYNSALCYAGNERLRSAVDRLGRGFSGEPFDDLKNYLLAGQGMADPYMCLADFDSYRLMHEKMYSDYLDRSGWSRKSLMNIAGSGFFAADRAVREYADRIWDLVPVGEDKRSYTANAPESAGASGHSEG